MPPNITPQRVSEFLNAIFRILWNEPDGLPAREAIASIPGLVQLTEHEMDFLPSSGFLRYEKTARLVTVPLTQVGWMSKNERGVWSLTDEGRQAVKQYPNMQDLFKEALRISDESLRTRPEITAALEAAQEMAWSQIEKHIQKMKHSELRALTAGLLKAMGYYQVWVSSAEKSRADMLFGADPLGVRGKRIFVQVKKNIGQAVTAEGIRAFASTLGENDFGLIVATSGFTNDAIDPGSEIAAKAHMLDAAGLFDLWSSHYNKVDDGAKRLLPLKQIYFLSGAE